MALDPAGTQSAEHPCPLEHITLFFSLSIWNGNGDYGLASIGLGALVGFIITVALGIIYPGLGYILGAFVGGIIAGVIARGIIGGAIAGFIAGVFSAIALAILAFLGFVAYGGLTHGFLGVLFGGLAGLALGIIVLIIGVFATVLSAIGGFIGGAVTR